MNHNDMYSMNNFDFLARSFARMRAQGHSVDLQAIVGNMDEKHRAWFCQRYEFYCRQVNSAAELEH
ncbi:cell surface composition regulator GlgS [Klebsiella aerogenes]|nr:cell surface composition regulator GlgS [Klebsiella aerogenes]